ncbi:hemolysin [Putridiphycobacter roseus]|uniref:Hemolysin n=1 Tax=Putridiphycobacter roseus TaxID=2219161 RepID=A0A2W1NER8_9FLAO|nr:GNAT family N-acetyltransferase [Putridiphycobacter roseus]PZE17945.1 hemolysin [Putridiphycobacter roseus]
MNKDLSYIIPPIEKSLLKAELTRDKFVRNTNKLDNEIYIITHLNAPNVMQEIGRLRELTFASAGGGTGKPVDIDDYDLGELPYEQLIVWAPEEEEIVGGYRFMNCAKLVKSGNIDLSTLHYFNFSPQFIADYLPYTVELGRSWIQPNFQPANSRKGLFSLDNLWDGLGAIVVENPKIRYYFGKVTMYQSYPALAKSMILSFMHYYFPDNDKLVWPKQTLDIDIKNRRILSLIEGKPFNVGYKLLQAEIRACDAKIPPLINNYMGLSATMKTFGTAVNNDFGAVDETAILVTIDDIFDKKKERHLDY